jgi:sphingomyelin phosphodiesterase
MLRFLTDELQDAEDQGDRGMSFLKHRPRVSMNNTLSSVWIVGHVPSGWDGTDPLEAPTNLCEF